jgi:hypothetical protein
MARNYLNIGSTPPDEDCAQVGSEDYHIKARAECIRYIERIREFCGPEPVGASLKIKSFPHDFGTYYEVVCWYDEDIKESVDYAFKVEGEGPLKWEGE